MRRYMQFGCAAAILVLAACDRPSAEEQRARDLALAMQMMNGQYPQVANPGELMLQPPQPGMAPQQGQWMYVPAGYVAQPAAVQQQPAVTRTVYRTASTAPAQRSAPAREPEKVTHVKRDAVIGAAAGGIAGAVIDRSVKGAVIGAAAGGVLGAVVGATIDVDRR